MASASDDREDFRRYETIRNPVIVNAFSERGNNDLREGGVNFSQFDFQLMGTDDVMWSKVLIKFDGKVLCVVQRTSMLVL